MSPRRLPIYGLLLFAAGLSACAAAPRQKPIPLGPTSGNLEAARQQFEGKWDLLSLDVTAADKRHATAEATGTMVADAYGNVDLSYRISDAGVKALTAVGVVLPGPVINTTGRVVIDPAKQTLAYVGEKPPDPYDPAVAAGRNNPFARWRTRYYSFAADGVLTLTTRHEDGGEAIVSRWKRSG